MVMVRPGRMADLYDLVQFSRGVAVESEGLEPDEETMRDSIAEALQDPHKARYFVAQDGEEGPLVGSLFVTYEWSDWTGGWYYWIQGAYVRPGSRRQGVLAALYQAVVQAARERGDVRSIRLYVEADNENARHAYEALGMRERSYVIYDAPLDPP